MSTEPKKGDSMAIDTEIQALIRAESEWHENNRASAPNEEYAKGFLRGLAHAFALIEHVRRNDYEIRHGWRVRR